MIDFFAALGLLLALEGILFAAFPSTVQHMLSEAAKSPTNRMRYVGIMSAVIGLIIIWTVRGNCII